MTKPPKHLSAEARKLWRKISAEYDLDVAGNQLLLALCEAHDRCTSARLLVTQHGPLVRGADGQLKANPACAIERDARNQQISILKTLSIDVDPQDSGRSPGRRELE